MDLMFSVIILFLIWGICLYHRASLLVNVCCLFATLATLTFLNIAGAATWYFMLVVVACITIPALRQILFTSFLYDQFSTKLPHISKTETEALHAGTVWWEAELFRGKPDWKKLHQYPAPYLTAEEKAFIDGPVNQVCEMANDFQITHELADLPPQIWDFLKKHRFFALIIKKQYGGLEFSAYAQSVILQKLASVSGILSITVGVPNSLGPGELLQRYGTEKQKNHYLPKLASGQEIPCFALTSTEAGSDATSIPDKGTVCEDIWQGEKVTGIRLNWNKRYITLAPVATVIGLAFKLKDPNHLLGQKTNIGITCALIPADLPGIEIGRRHFPLNVPFQNGPTQGHNVFIPLDFIIGGAAMAGQGWKMLVDCLSVGRGITLPSNSSGVTKTAALTTGAYARIRHQFKQPIGKMEGIEEPLARLGGNAYLIDAACRLTTTGINSGEKPSIISAIVKLHTTHRTQHVLKDAMDILAGKSICLGPSNYLARYYQSAPIAVTVEGANILTRSMIIFGQGIIRCHPYIIQEMEIARSDHQHGQKAFDKVLSRHIIYILSNLVRSVWFGLTDGIGTSSPVKDQTKRYYQQLTRYSANLALLADITLLTQGARLKRKERLSARLGDIISHLYLASSCLKRYEDEGRCEEDLPLLQWAMEDCMKEIETAIIQLLHNYPSRWLSRWLKWKLMPFGSLRRGPDDKLDHQVAMILQSPVASRNRLGCYLYQKPVPNNPAGMINQALDHILEAEPIFEKICQHKSEHYPFMKLDKLAAMALREELISEEEAHILVQAEKERLYVIDVDDFSSEELVCGRQK
ncbi:acyl-CoA dehydrogenase FadE [Vibrio quintilis]|uniref:Acyl-coenzyme A dehydrogenase n=1 Tax=Vibrio quintilis TaxID=1117707 RepID=A0A1M7Z120_9VIBR|nr:acyl-CoA dehydrogenase FadE [Vibrio quintilis]SHO58561.1 Acyl-coenzyme A dehydrogenase [Vibrio quintilis]